MSDREIFRKNLMKYMEQTGRKQVDVAKFVGVSDKTVNAWVRGRGYPRADAMEKLSMFFGVRLSDLVDEKPDEDTEEMQLVNIFRSLSSVGKIKLLERAEELTVLYGKKSSYVPDRKVL